MRIQTLIWALVFLACSEPASSVMSQLPAPAVPAPFATHGAAAGEVTAHSASIWARANRACAMRVELEGGGGRREEVREVTGSTDFTGALAFEDLSPGTRYDYTVWFETDGAKGRPVRGRFRTGPDSDQPVAVTFAFGGDVGGQNVCRDAGEGYRIFDVIRRQRPDFFVALGDMIYADNRCNETGTFGNRQVPGDFPGSTELPHFWAHWRYNRVDPAHRALLAEVPYYAVWDDHEVVNDFGPSSAGKELLPLGLRAFADYNPVDPEMLYRAVRWGAHVELFILDTRNYRDANTMLDAGEKSMLGADQRAWLERALIDSDATWRIVVTSVPLSIPTGTKESGLDSWAGFGSELRTLFEPLAAAGISNTVWITTDVHFATGFRYTPFPDRPEFFLHEIVTGPMNAGLFPTDAVDPTFHPERLFFYAPAEPVTSWANARRFMNFGTISVNEAGDMTVAVVNGDGETVWTSPIPRPK